MSESYDMELDSERQLHAYLDEHYKRRNDMPETLESVNEKVDILTKKVDELLNQVAILTNNRRQCGSWEP